MPRTRDDRRREELLAAVIETLAANGIGDRSMRDIGAAAGTSHRMLVYHFGSRDRMLLAVVEEIERRQKETLRHLDLAPADIFRVMWADLRRSELRPFERLFFECYARAAQGEAPFTRLLPGAVESWLTAVDETTVNTNPALARLGLAVVRGLLLDLVATNDEQGLDRAAHLFASLIESPTANPVEA